MASRRILLFADSVGLGADRGGPAQRGHEKKARPFPRTSHGALGEIERCGDFDLLIVQLVLMSFGFSSARSAFAQIAKPAG